MSNAIIDNVPVTQTSEAISVNSISRTIGSSIGTATIAAILTSHSATRGLPSDKAFTIGFWACAGVALLAVLCSLLLPRRRTHRPAALVF